MIRKQTLFILCLLIVATIGCGGIGSSTKNATPVTPQSPTPPVTTPEDPDDPITYTKPVTPVIPTTTPRAMDFSSPAGDEEGGVFGFLNTNDPTTDQNLNDIYYIRFMVKKSSGDLLFQSGTIAANTSTYTTEKHSIEIYGTKIVIKKGNDATGYNNKLYDTLNNDSNITDLYIYAEQIEIYNHLRIPGANVHIFARNLVFSSVNDSTDDFSCIDTTPSTVGLLNTGVFNGTVFAVNVRPPTWIDPTIPDASINDSGNLAQGYSDWISSDFKSVKASRAGANAGNVDLNISQIDQGNDGAKSDSRFILKGERGEHAGLGRNGIHGTDATAYVTYRITPLGTLYLPSAGAVYIQVLTSLVAVNIPAYPLSNPWETSLSNMKDSAYLRINGSAYIEFPTNGEDSVQSGIPGKGGNGGTITSTVPIVIATANFQGGQSGSIGEYESQSTFIGGRGGYPTCAITASAGYSTRQGTSSDWLIIESTITEISRAYTTKGADTSAPSSPDGANGSVKPVTTQYSYLHPIAVGQMILKIKDLFLSGYRDQAYAKSVDYATLLQTYSQSPEWATLDDNKKEDLLKYLYEIRQMQQKLEGNLDYFGNPSGWVPMVSFEVAMSAYQKEIENAIQVMYLRYWLTQDFRKSVDVQQTCTNMRDTANTEMLAMRQTDLPDAYAKMTTLAGEAKSIDNNLVIEKANLQKLTDKLVAEAKDLASPSKFQKIMRIGAAIMKTIPVEQPLIGMLGAPLALAGMDSNANLGDICNTLEPYTANAKDINTLTKTYMDQMKNYNTLLSIGVSAAVPPVPTLSYTSMNTDFSFNNLKGIYSAYKGQAIPSSTVEKILQRLMAESWDYQLELKKIKELMAEKQTKAKEIAEASDKLNTIINEIAKRADVITNISSYLANNTTIGFENVMGYVDDMDRLSRERLLKYHYYMAKAYEYRMLKRYEGNLTIQNIFNTVVNQYQESHSTNPIGTNRQLTSDQFASLKSIYQSQISAVVQEMYTNKVNNPPSYGMPVSFRLTDSQLDDLNTNGKLTFNPVKSSLFYPTEENLRISNITIIFNTNADNTFTGNSGYVELKAVHSGISVIESRGQRYLFKHYNSSTENAKAWATRKDLILGETYTSKPTATETTLLATLLGNTDSDIAYYSLPAAQADITIIKKVQTSNGISVQVKNVIVKIEYEFTEHKDCSTIKILAANDSLAPLITIDRTDTMGQKDGYGYFTRSYTQSDGSVTIIAPETYGEWNFYQWVDDLGQPYGSGPSVVISLSDVTTIRPIYKNPALDGATQ
jgi:hypothetical protein